MLEYRYCMGAGGTFWEIWAPCSIGKHGLWGCLEAGCCSWETCGAFCLGWEGQLNVTCYTSFMLLPVVPPVKHPSESGSCSRDCGVCGCCLFPPCACTTHNLRASMLRDFLQDAWLAQHFFSLAHVCMLCSCQGMHGCVRHARL